MTCVLYNLFQKIKVVELHSILFYEISINLMTKPDKGIIKKRSYKTSLMNIDVKSVKMYIHIYILHKYLYMMMYKNNYTMIYSTNMQILFDY